MSPKVYVLIDNIAGESGWVTQTLRTSLGVILADELEEQSRIIMVVQADDREKLAMLTIQAIHSVESVTDDIQLLPARNEVAAYSSLERVPLRTRRSRRN